MLSLSHAHPSMQGDGSTSPDEVEEEVEEEAEGEEEGGDGEGGEGN